MTCTYIDSSALLTVIFQEKNYQDYQRKLDKSDNLISSYLLEAEIYSTTKREKISLQIADDYLKYISMLLPDRSLQPEYHKIFQVGYCRGADAHHIASALYLDPAGQDLYFLSADKKQCALAKKVGLRTN